MLNFQTVTKTTFLKEYWQKKPLLIKNALPQFTHPLDADELAGLAMEEDIESRIIAETPGQIPQWHLKKGPFLDSDFQTLAKTHWTLLVQGVDRFVPEVSDLLDAFDFLPQWRIDDVMISYASLHGSVGPHYDNYDVFLYQASGQRKWSLTTKHCHESNAVPNLDLRIMANFEIEEEIILSEGDMLYLPAHVGHHGVSLTADCIGVSFGYRSYQAQELWDSFGDYLSENHLATALYQDPLWTDLSNTAELPVSACFQARQLMQTLLNDDHQLQQWFSRFATQLDQQAMSLSPQPLQADEAADLNSFVEALNNAPAMRRDLNCRMAYYLDSGKLHLCINGYPFECAMASSDCIKMIASQRRITKADLAPFLTEQDNQDFLYRLWKEQWISIQDEDND